MDKRYWEEMAEAMMFLGDTFVEVGASPLQVREIADYVRACAELKNAASNSIEESSHDPAQSN